MSKKRSNTIKDWEIEDKTRKAQLDDLRKRAREIETQLRLFVDDVARKTKRYSLIRGVVPYDIERLETAHSNFRRFNNKFPTPR